MAYLGWNLRPAASEPGGQSTDLALQWTAVVRAREFEDKQRRRLGSNARQMLSARKATLRALEDYARALIRRGFPVPRRLSREIALQRFVCTAPVGAPSQKRFDRR